MKRGVRDHGILAAMGGLLHAFESGADSRRRYYRLTKAGRALLNQELARMESVVRKAKTMRLAVSR